MNVAVVGANRGIGLALCQQLVAKKHNVYAYCRKASPELKELSVAKMTENFDVTDAKTLSATLKEQNLPKLDILFHVAGIMRSESLEDFHLETLREQFEVNALAPVLCVQAFLPYLKEGSKVGLLTSRMGSVADNTSGGMYGYRMSKAALNMAGMNLAHDLKPRGVTVLLLHPGYVQTDMTEHRGMITPEQSAQGLIEVVGKHGLAESGTFWHVNGEPLPW